MNLNSLSFGTVIGQKEISFNQYIFTMGHIGFNQRFPKSCLREHKFQNLEKEFIVVHLPLQYYYGSRKKILKN